MDLEDLRINSCFSDSENIIGNKNPTTHVKTKITYYKYQKENKMKNKWFLITILTLALMFILAACSSAGGNAAGGSSGEGEGELPPVAAVRAREALAAELGIGVEKVEILSQEQTEWMDSCLGLGGPAESCLQALVSGWRVELSAEGKTYVARTDETGDAVRFEE
jgi:hypothetical protein